MSDGTGIGKAPTITARASAVSQSCVGRILVGDLLPLSQSSHVRNGMPSCAAAFAWDSAPRAAFRRAGVSVTRFAPQSHTRLDDDAHRRHRL